MITLPVTCNEIKIGLLIALALFTAWSLYEGYTTDNNWLIAIGLAICLVSGIFIGVLGGITLLVYCEENVRCRCNNDN